MATSLAEPCPPEGAPGGSRRLALTREDGKLKPCPDLLASVRELGFSETALDSVAIWSVAYSPDGSQLAIASQEHDLQIVDARSLRRKLELPTMHHDSVRSVAYHPRANGKWLASASLDGTILLWDLQSYRTSGQWTVARLEGHTHWIWAIAFDRTGGSLASAGYDGAVGLWSVWPEPTAGSVLLHSEGERWDGVWASAFSSDGETLASGGTDGQLTFWDVTSRQPVDRCATSASSSLPAVTSIAASSRGTFASGIANGSVLLWDARDCKPTVLGARQPQVWSVAFSPDARTVASGGSDGSIVLWDADGNAPPRTLAADSKSQVWSLAFSPDGRLLAAGHHNATIAVWDLESGTPPRVLRGHLLDVRSLAFSADGRWLASGSLDRSIGLWDVGTWEAVRWLRDQKVYVSSVAFSPDGTSIYAGGWGGRLIRWDRDTGAALWSFSGHDGNIWSVSVSPKGNGLLASGDDAGVLILWEDPMRAQDEAMTRSLLKRACAVAAGLALEQQVLDRYQLTEQNFRTVCSGTRITATPTVP
jgi:WD40 repeat protein